METSQSDTIDIGKFDQFYFAHPNEKYIDISVKFFQLDLN
jgi:hypothetical protein